MPKSTQTSYDHIPAVPTQKVFRNAYSPRKRVVTPVVGESRTKQSFRDECDINRIMARYQKTGVLEFLEKREARYADVSSLDYQEACNLVAGAQSMFHELPSALRSRFDNDPAQLLAFLDNAANLQEAIDLGLVERPASVPAVGSHGEPRDGVPPNAGDARGGDPSVTERSASGVQ